MFSHKPALKQQLSKAASLFRRLFSLKVIQVVLVFFILLLTTPIILFVILRPKIQKDINYGITFSSRYASQMSLNWRETYLNIIGDLGAKNLRLVAYWDEIEKTQDSYDFTNIKWQVEEAQKRNLNVILAIGRKVPRYPECFEPTWWKELPSDQDVAGGKRAFLAFWNLQQPANQKRIGSKRNRISKKLRQKTNSCSRQRRRGILEAHIRTWRLPWDIYVQKNLV
jgi:hypothetical protein